jgi:heat shock protein HtpX
MLTYTEISKNKSYSALLIFVFLIFIIALGWVFSQAYNSPGLLVLAVVFSSVSALVSYYFSDSITLALSQAHPVDRQTNQELYRLVENLTIAAGLPVPRIYIIKDSAPNAFATGRDPKHAVIVFTTGILEKLNKTELEAVTAHELSHVGNYDIRFMTLVVVLVGIVTLLADWFLRISFFGGGRRSRDNNDNNGAQIFLIIGLVLAILSPIVATLIKLAVSRKREFLADASGVMLTRYPEALASALEKISRDPEPLEAANKATAHLYIVNPLRGKHGSVSWFANLFNTHPPIEERIKRLRGMNM